MRAFVLFALGAAAIALGLYTCELQARNCALAATLDRRQRRLELEHMCILNGEARILEQRSLAGRNGFVEQSAEARP